MFGFVFQVDKVIWDRKGIRAPRKSIGMKGIQVSFVSTTMVQVEKWSIQECEQSTVAFDYNISE